MFACARDERRSRASAPQPAPRAQPGFISFQLFRTNGEFGKSGGQPFAVVPRPPDETVVFFDFG